MEIKIAFLIIVVSVSNLLAIDTYSQIAKVSLDMDDRSLEQVMNEIERQSEFYFIFNQRQIDIQRRVDIKAENKLITDILPELFNGTNIYFAVFDKKILLTTDPIENNLLTSTSIRELQQKQVSGVVKGENGNPLPGVYVIVTGTNVGRITDINGAFTIDIPEGAESLTFTFIGMEPQVIIIGTSTQFNVTMIESAVGLDEVVVVGYGTQKKRLVTGATVEVKSNDIINRAAVSPLTALQGQTPGLSIFSTSGQPGSDFRVYIRGTGTVSETTPLYIVDGVQTSDIRFLNNSDIASIDILKDAASAAIYGARAANGVILITTKKGSSGASRLSFDAYYGIQNAAKIIDVLDGRDYILMMNEMASNSGLPLPYSNEAQVESILQDVNGGTNYIDLLLEDNVPTQSYNLSAQGGNDASVYAISLSYTQQGGIIGGKDLENYERYTFRTNTEHKLYKDIIKIGENFNFSSVINTGGNNTTRMGSAIRMLPVIPNMNPNNPLQFYYNNSPAAGGNNDLGLWSTEITNPYATMLYDNDRIRNTNKVIGDVYLNFKIIKDLNFKTSLSLDYSSQKYRNYQPLYPNISIGTNSSTRRTGIDQTYQHSMTLTLDNVLSYSKTIMGVHELDGIMGMSLYKNTSEYLAAGNKNLLYPGMDYAWIDNATGTASAGTMTMSSYPSEDALLSYFGRLSYAYKGKYMLTGILRSDGSSRFDEAHRRGYFPSISIGWNITSESFMTSISWLNSLKLRASWGQNGNMNIPPYYYLPLVSPNYSYSFGSDGFMETGARVYREGNPRLAWEKAQSTNIGFDSRLFDDKLSFTFDWYNRETRDWLIRANVPTIIGRDAPYINGGSVINRGVEFSLGYLSTIGKEFSYSLNANIAFNKNEVGSIPTKDGILHGGTGTLYANSSEVTRSQDGFPLGFFWGLKTNGIFQTGEEVNSYKNQEGALIQPLAKPGDIRYIDENQDGKISELDKTMIGDGHPKTVFGFSLNFEYKGFDFNVSANGVSGNVILQNYIDANRNYWNYTQDLWDQRWHGEGTSTKFPKFDAQNSNWIQFSDIFLYKGGYLKINTVSLGYDLGRIFDSFNKVRVYVAGKNVYTFTSYNGMDPEVGWGGNNVDNSEMGRDRGIYPNPRTVLFGINLIF